MISSRLFILALCAAAWAPAQAEKADRSKPLTIEAEQSGSIDLIKQVVILNGNVVVSQGTMAIRAERMEVRERPDGYRAVVALGSAGKPADFRQKLDSPGETIEGHAERIEYDGRGDVVRLMGNAQLRRLRGGLPADEASGSVITYDSGNETFSVQGGSSVPGSDRVRMILTPKPEPASAPAAEPRR